MQGNTDIYGSIPFDYQTKENGNIDFDTFTTWDNQDSQNMFKSPAGTGMAVDLGVVWQPTEPLTLSASLTDFIPFRHAKIISDSGQTTTLPYSNKRLSFQFGTVLTIF